MTVLTISAQFGAGAREVGRPIADRLGLEYMDHAVLIEAARALGVTVNAVAEHDERTDTLRERLAGFLQRALERSAVGGNADPFMGAASLELMLAQTYGEAAEGNRPVQLTDSVYLDTISRVIQDLAERDNLVILGRGGQMILRDSPGVWHCQLIADLPLRIERVQEWESLSEADAKKRIQEFDRGRARFHKKFWDVDVWDPRLYHAVINTTHISYATAAEMIALLVRAQAVASPRAGA